MQERKQPHLHFASLVACVPTQIEENSELEINGSDLSRVITTTGIERKRLTKAGQTTADLATKAGQQAIEKSGVSIEEINVLVFVTQTPDFQLPSTAHVLQHKLGLSQNCVVLQVNEGCSGFVYGMYIIGSMLRSDPSKHGLLLVGDTISKICGQQDPATRPLFGDAAAAAVVKLDPEKTDTFVIGGSGEGWQDIWVPNQEKDGSKDVIESKSANASDNFGKLKLDGMNVFTFGITRVPKLISGHAELAGKDLNSIDYFILHQANRMMNQKIRKKLKVEEDKFPSSLEDFGNTSSCSIPLTMVHNLQAQLTTSTTSVLLCGFGVGLSWASVITTLSPLMHIELIED